MNRPGQGQRFDSRPPPLWRRSRITPSTCLASNSFRMRADVLAGALPLALAGVEVGVKGRQIDDADAVGLAAGLLALLDDLAAGLLGLHLDLLPGQFVDDRLDLAAGTTFNCDLGPASGRG